MSQRVIRLSELAELVGGTLIGDPEVPIRGASPLYEVQPGELTLVDAATLPPTVHAQQPAAILVRKSFLDAPCPQIVVDHPREAFAAIVASFLPAEEVFSPQIDPHSTIHPTAVIGVETEVSCGVFIGPHVQVGKRCQIMPGTVVMERCVIGDDCVLFPNLTLYPRTQVGDRVVIHAGTVLGAYGFGYTPRNGRHERTPQLGYVVIENDVELGACVTIDRGTFGSTRIGEGTKVDNQVMIGHNCQIGRHNLLCSQVGIAGSCRTGDYVVLAGQVGLKDHITLGDRVVVGAQSGVMDDLAGGQVYLGSPATTQREQMQIMAVQRKLPELRRTIKELQRGNHEQNDHRAA